MNPNQNQKSNNQDPENTQAPNLPPITTPTRLQQSQFTNGLIRPLMLCASVELANGDLYYGTANNTFVRVPGSSATSGQVLTFSPAGVPFWNPVYQIIASDPVAPVEGVIWYNSTSHVFKYWNGTAIKTITAT